jgi:hypothetical protein
MSADRTSDGQVLTADYKRCKLTQNVICQPIGCDDRTRQRALAGAAGRQPPLTRLSLAPSISLGREPSRGRPMTNPIGTGRPHDNESYVESSRHECNDVL